MIRITLSSIITLALAATVHVAADSTPYLVIGMLIVSGFLGGALVMLAVLSDGAKMMYTPWGEAQDIDTIADGITWVSTASHGGFIISAERRAAMPKSLREFETFAGGNNYEEDCDAAIVIAAFPEHFSAAQVARAVSSIDAGEGRYFKGVQVGDAARSRV